MHDRHAVGLLLILVDHHDGGELAVPGELADLPHRVLMAVAVGRSRDVVAVGEEGGDVLGFFVDGGVEGGRDEDLGSW